MSTAHVRSREGHALSPAPRTSTTTDAGCTTATPWILMSVYWLTALFIVAPFDRRYMTQATERAFSQHPAPSWLIILGWITTATSVLATCHEVWPHLCSAHLHVLKIRTTSHLRIADSFKNTYQDLWYEKGRRSFCRSELHRGPSSDDFAIELLSVALSVDGSPSVVEVCKAAARWVRMCRCSGLGGDHHGSFPYSSAYAMD